MSFFFLFLLLAMSKKTKASKAILTSAISQMFGVPTRVVELEVEAMDVSEDKGESVDPADVEEVT